MLSDGAGGRRLAAWQGPQRRPHRPVGPRASHPPALDRPASTNLRRASYAEAQLREHAASRSTKVKAWSRGCAGRRRGRGRRGGPGALRGLWRVDAIRSTPTSCSASSANAFQQRQARIGRVQRSARRRPGRLDARLLANLRERLSPARRCSSCRKGSPSPPPDHAAVHADAGLMMLYAYLDRHPVSDSGNSVDWYAQGAPRLQLHAHRQERRDPPQRDARSGPAPTT